MDPKELSEIIIGTCKLSTKRTEVLDLFNKDPRLVEQIDFLEKRLQDDNTEVFEKIGNILIAENGYHLALFSKDIIKIEDHDEADNKILNASEEELDEILRAQGYDPEKLEENGKELLERLKNKLKP